MTKDRRSILICDDEVEICQLLSRLVKKEGYKALTATDGETALEMIKGEDPDLIFLDIRMPGISGLEVLQRLKNLKDNIPVVMITAHAGVRGAVEAMKLGAHDYLVKPMDFNEVVRVIRRAITERDLKTKIRLLSDHLQGQGSLVELMGTSDPIRRLVADVNCVASSNFSVIILGETGVGKELVAKAIHDASPRAKGPFISIDCGAIPETLLESELFGHEKGAFTGADRQKRGKLETAQNGTIFLDEIANLPMSSQVKLLRAIQEKSLYRLGSLHPNKVDIRFIVATNKDLSDIESSSSFRLDLFYRLNEFILKVPPLRERREDIIYLAKRFLHITNAELKKSVRGFSDTALEVLSRYEWPGNVRQLRSCIRRAVLLADDLITAKHLGIKNVERVEAPDLMPLLNGLSAGNKSLKEIAKLSVTRVEKEVLLRVLKQVGGNKAKAARILKIDYKTIHNKVKNYGIQINGGDND